MINVNELRLGNLICKYGEYMEVNDINQFGNDGKPKINGWDEEDFAPIPLTPEWLAKLGFEQGKSNDIEERDIWSIQVANNTSLYYDPELPGKEWYLSLEWNNNHWQNEFWANPKSVHQLQKPILCISWRRTNN